VFSGRFEHTIDGKGRTSFPSRFREILAPRADGRIILTTGLDPHLVAYPLKEWTAFEERLAALPQFDESVMMLRRVYVSGAVECEVDGLGRLLIPQVLRDYAGLRREVIWAGMGLNIELWEKGRYEHMRENVLADPEKKRAMHKRLSELGL
jgi:MraZ protein